MNPRATHWLTLRRTRPISKRRAMAFWHSRCLRGTKHICQDSLLLFYLWQRRQWSRCLVIIAVYICLLFPVPCNILWEKRAAARSHKPTTLLLSPNHSRTSDETTVRPNLFIFPTTPFDSMCVCCSESDLQKWKPVYVLDRNIIRLVADHSGLLVFIFTLYDRLCVYCTNSRSNCLASLTMWTNLLWMMSSWCG